MTVAQQAGVDPGFRLDDRYTHRAGRIYLTGVQALVRLILDRAHLDRAARRNTASYISGYEGSPLGGFDLEVARRRDLLDPLGIRHEPGCNEELAATAIAGTQLARAVADLRCDGVTGYWYGKAPGLDRATDALRHANMMGADHAGGAVAFVGDDPAAKSSSLPSSSEMALADLDIPTLVPADAADVLELGRHAVELSRASGLWTALRITAVVADGAVTTDLTDDWMAPDINGHHTSLRAYSHRPSAHMLGRTLAELERSMRETRLPLALEYLRLSGINRIEGPAMARVGIVAAGPTYFVVRQALTALGLDDERLAAQGIRLLKLGAVYPLEPTVIEKFADGLQRILVVEDKRPFLEAAVKAILYSKAAAPAVDGKQGLNGRKLFSPLGDLDAGSVLPALADWLAAVGVENISEIEPPRLHQQLPLSVSTARSPYFCSGCPHNSSTKVVPGTLVGAGVGCHHMLLVMPSSEARGKITGSPQMGGEGMHWVGMEPFVEQQHFVQNLGDGTFAHSGSLAIRAAVAAGTNITFKLLRNSAVAMTGGQQPVGDPGLKRVVDLLTAEGVRRIVVTSDDPKATGRQVGRGIDVRHRDDLVDAQRELAAVKGVTVIIHEQECAAELRRKRRRGKAERPAMRAFINERVCEGCGDCGVKSNCLAVRPVDTDYGRKTAISQSSCNFDFSCLEGDCPSFLTVRPGVKNRALPDVASPPEPTPKFDGSRFRMRITGIGGTGVVTVAQIVSTAAHLQGRFVRTLDQTGLAQKGGPVVSDVVISGTPGARGPKLGPAECDLYLGCDLLVAGDPANLRVCDPGRTEAVVSTSEVPTGQMVIDTAAALPSQLHTAAAIASVAREAKLLDAAALSAQQLGSDQYANIMLLGAAYQRGALPVSAEMIESAIRINGTAVAANVAAFRLGRRAVYGPSGEPPDNDGVAAQDVNSLVAQRESELRRYQSDSYARGYREFVDRVRAREASVTDGTELTEAVARNLFKLMAYKDEYEVARLCLAPELTAAVEAEFGAGATYRYRLHPPILRALGMKRKISLGPWSRPVFRLLVAMRGLRDTPFDPFGRTKLRAVERALVTEYREIVDELSGRLTRADHELAVQVANLPDVIRGYEEIKLRNISEYHALLAELTQRYRQPRSGTIAGLSDVGHQPEVRTVHRNGNALESHDNS